MAATPKPRRKSIKSGQALSRKVNKELMTEGKSRLTPDKKSNVQHLKYVHKVNAGGVKPTKKDVKDIKKGH